MSQVSNEEIVRHAFESFEHLNMDGFTANWHPEVIWDVSGYDSWTGDKSEYCGTHEVLAGFADYLAGARSFEVSGLQVTALDDTRVLGLHNERRVNEGDSTPIEIDIGVVYHLTDGTLTRAEVYTGHDTARKAAGLV
jgi:ketosteroid isomerase-like protein